MSFNQKQAERKKREQETRDALRKQALSGDLSLENLTFKDSADKELHNTDNATVLKLNVANVYAEEQVRTEFNETDIIELAASIRAQGLIQPIVVFPKDDKGRYKIYTGERRWRAVTYLTNEYPHENHKVLAIVNPALKYESATKIQIGQLIENAQRKDLTDIELATALKRLRDEGMSINDICTQLGWVSKTGNTNRSEVYKRLSYFELPENGKALVESKCISDLNTIYMLQRLSLIDMVAYNELIAKAEAEQGIRRTVVETRLQQAQGRSAGDTASAQDVDVVVDVPRETQPSSIGADVSNTNSASERHHGDTDIAADDVEDTVLEDAGRHHGNTLPSGAVETASRLVPTQMPEISGKFDQPTKAGQSDNVDLSNLVEIHISFNNKSGILDLTKRANKDDHIWVRLLPESPDENEMLVAVAISAVQLQEIKYKKKAKVELRQLPKMEDF